ncbi:MAG: META domain-containing protein [Acidobacteria bacterium]|nr:META domain-containing protein [Acidobacteriota bacterium]
MKNQSIRLLGAAFAVVLTFSVHVVAQSQYSWLDDKPLPSWSERSRAILQTEKIGQSELARCRNVIRPATLPVDRLLTKYNWTLVGDAQVFGRATAVTVAQGFDGMCRPRGFQTLVFVGNLVAGTLSPGPMDSRILADCNRGNGTYKLDGQSLRFSGFASTRMACAPGSLDSRFLQSLDAARIYKMEGDALYVDLFADSGTMKFVKANR